MDSQLSQYQQARMQKDPLYDGQFIFAVKTTGVCCRPSCPAPVAKEKNVEYFENIFQAVEQGYRPCMRCRPDLSYDHFANVNSGAELVDKALSMMNDGFLSFHSLEELADKLNISSRHLRHLFIQHVGMAPVKVSQMHKVMFAKAMLLQSSYTVTDVAYASGFGSIRQFNTIFKQITGFTPTQMKENQLGKTMDDGSAVVIPCPDGFDFSQMLSFLKDRAINGVERVLSDAYERSFRIGDLNGSFKVALIADGSSLALTIQSNDARCFPIIYQRVRKMFDLDTNLESVNKHLKKFAPLRRGMVAGQVPRLPQAFDPEEFIVRAILGQQISVKAATTLAGRIVERVGKKLDHGIEGIDLLFPTAQEIIDTDLSGLGISNTRQATLIRTCEALVDNRFQLNTYQKFEAFHDAFTAIKGIGDWTANYVGMRGLGYRDVFPASDLGVLKSLEQNGVRPSVDDVIEQSQQWRPYRSYATLCLWNALS